MAALWSVGTLLQNSGWTGVLTESGITTSGTAESFLSAASVTRCRQAHQITACTLFKLMKAAYMDYCSDTGDLLSCEDWYEKRKRESPLFQYWNLILAMKLTIFVLVRSFREANFALYCEALSELIPYFFANNNVNYARWAPVHLRDMLSLEKRHPQLAREFQNGHFVVHKSERDFSAMPIDQAHEQANAVIKGDGGAVGLTEDPSALRRWMVAGPEVIHLIAQYVSASKANDAAQCFNHHEQRMQTQRLFFEKVEKLTTTIQDLGNPFQEESGDLLTLDTKDIADRTASEVVGKHHEIGRNQFTQFMKGLESGDERLFYQPIKRNKLTFFKQEPVQSDHKHKALKDDYRLFSQLIISCQSRQCDLHDFFKYENHSVPAALSDNGKIHACQKSQLVDILEAHIKKSDNEPEADVIIIDGSALVNSLAPQFLKTFDDYAKEDFIPAVNSFSAKYKRTDIVFDLYISSSLKSDTREKRGRGARRRVTSKNRTPKNWKAFMRDSDNKTELFHFLAEKIVEIITPNTVIATFGENVICNKDINFRNLTPCTQEEADTRMFVHARHAALEGHRSVVIKANDTDVLVIAVAVLSSLANLGQDKMWILFGQGAHLRYIPVHDIVSAIGPEKASGLLFFHAFTGCDVTSAFRGKGKKSAWLTWDVCAATSSTFTKLSQHPPTLEDTDLQTLEKFVITMYDRSSDCTNVNEARMDLFARKQRAYESITPTQSALEQHTKRSAYQAGLIWSQATVCQPEVQSPSHWGWMQQDGRWVVRWTPLPPIATCCQELTKCGCKTECHGRCKCYRLGLVCTALCGCACHG